MDVYTKFDFHIHSWASAKTKTGDQAIVANSTIENLPILTQKLIDNNVNIVAITDHNIFDKELYEELKKQESIDNCIFKVLPGVEFDLSIKGKNVHAVCIFDDFDSNHSMRIENGFQSKDQYSLDELGAILRSIELSVVLIAHQKSDYKSQNPQKNSLSCAGQDAFYKFIGCEFFDSLEIQNSKVEGILKARFAEDSIEDMNYIVGSDCHEWASYPAHDSQARPIELMYMKSLPTFQGLVMAVTDYSRIFKNPEPIKENVLKKIDISLDGNTIGINLSHKINVIIGDNAVGKSTMIKILTGNAEKSAVEFYKSHNIEVLTPKLNGELYTYNGQGKIREMFESTEEKLPIRQKFKDNFKLIDKAKYSSVMEGILRYYRILWERNERIVENRQMINSNIYIPTFYLKDNHYLSINIDLDVCVNKYEGLNSVIEEIILAFKKLNEYTKQIEMEDKNKLISMKNELVLLLNKYKNIEKTMDLENEIKNVFIYSSTMYNEGISKISSSDEQSYSNYAKESRNAIDAILKDVEFKFSAMNNAWDTFEEFKVNPSINTIGKYCFIDKPINKESISKELIIQFISKYIDINKPLEEMTTSEIVASIKGKKIADRSAQNINEFLSIIFSLFKNKFFNTTVEIKKGDDQLNESNSAGINALYYLDILSYTYSKSIFIVDQPEDDVSQSRISSDLIPSLKNLSKKAQIILVTHNPQLVVNLDADNVLVMKKEENQIQFYSGPLEYKTEEFSILGLVANTLDGGTDVIKKRWKRYAKTNI